LLRRQASARWFESYFLKLEPRVESQISTSYIKGVELTDFSQLLSTPNPEAERCKRGFPKPRLHVVGGARWGFFTVPTTVDSPAAEK